MKPTKKEIKTSKKHTNVEHYLDEKEMFYCIKDMRKKFASISDMVQLAGILQRWSKKPTSFSLEQFVCEQEITMSAFKRWRKVCPELEAAAQSAKLWFGVRRENGALTNQLNPQMAKLTAVHFLPRMKEAIEYAESVKKESGNPMTQPVINVVMPPAKVTDIVPEKPKKAPTVLPEGA